MEVIQWKRRLLRAHGGVCSGAASRSQPRQERSTGTQHLISTRYRSQVTPGEQRILSPRIRDTTHPPSSVPGKVPRFLLFLRHEHQTGSDETSRAGVTPTCGRFRTVTQDTPSPPAPRDPPASERQDPTGAPTAFHRTPTRPRHAALPRSSPSLHNTLLQNTPPKKTKNLYSKDTCPKNNVIFQQCHFKSQAIEKPICTLKHSICLQVFSLTPRRVIGAGRARRGAPGRCHNPRLGRGRRARRDRRVAGPGQSCRSGKLICLVKRTGEMRAGLNDLPAHRGSPRANPPGAEGTPRSWGHRMARTARDSEDRDRC